LFLITGLASRGPEKPGPTRGESSAVACLEERPVLDQELGVEAVERRTVRRRPKGSLGGEQPE
jgi:hypothetical protein